MHGTRSVMLDLERVACRHEAALARQKERSFSMKSFMLFPLALILASVLPAMAVETANPDLGRALFASPQLGKSGRSCADCHPGGKGLEKISDFSDAELKDIINACVRDALQGTLLAADSPELNALLLHIRSFRAK
jgi:cytochrome c peroxidase